MAAADLDGLMTESRGADVDLDLLTSRELVELMNVEDALVAPAVRTTALEIADMIDAIVERLVREVVWSMSERGRPARSQLSMRTNAKRPSPPLPARSSRSSPVLD